MSLFSRPSRKALELELAHASAILENQQREQKGNQFEDVLMRLIAAQDGILDNAVTPDSCMQSPTVHAIVTGVSRRLSVTPIHVYQKTEIAGKPAKIKQPNHPLAQLLRKPNSWQSPVDFWQDAASCFVRWGRFPAYKSQDGKGRVRELIPLHPRAVELKLNDKYTLQVKIGGDETPRDKLFYARGPSRDFLNGDSPINDVKRSILMEMMAEQFGESFFRNGAQPLMVLRYMQGIRAFKTDEEERKFVEDFKEAFGGKNRFNAMLLPQGIEQGTPVPVENDKAQFIESRKYQRTVIAGALGFPVHLAGDLERATYNNIEQQDQDFTLNMVMPVAKAFESAMERDLLTDQDRNDGIIVRFNMDGILRADFKSRQEGLKIQREMGVINPDEWREVEGMNPRMDGGGDYWDQGPSGQGAGNAGAGQ